MDITKNAVEVLVDAENRLRKLMADAASAGNYDAIQPIAEWAKVVGALTAEHQKKDTARTPKPLEGKTNRPDVVAQRQDNIEGESYPRFARRGDQLVKTGWSRRENKEYEHSAPQRVVESLALSIARRSRNGRVFSAKHLFPIKDPQDQSDVPTYQSYVALAWLRRSGFLKQHGRRGYSLRKSVQLTSAVADAWLRLPELTASNG